MLYHLLYKLSKIYDHIEFFSIFNVFGYITFRAVISFIITFVLCLILFPKFITLLNNWKAKQVIRDDGPSTHVKKTGTPTMGGLLIIISILTATAVCGNFKNTYILIILFATVSFGLIGFLDDYLKITKKTSDGLHAKFKLISQIIVSFIVSYSIYCILGKDFIYITVPFFKNLRINLNTFVFYLPLLGGIKFNLGLILYILFSMFIIVGTSNAVNITDGLDGLASGLLIAVASTFGLLSYLSGHEGFAKYLLIDFLPLSGELLVYCMALIGGLCGFLWFNCHPASIFMGDTGSISFGGIIGTIALMIKQELLLAVIGGVFAAEMMSVIIQILYFKMTKKRFFKMAPLHHHFELKGWPESKVIARFWIAGGILAVIALGTLKLR